MVLLDTNQFKEGWEGEGREGRKVEGGEIRKDHGWWILGKYFIQNKSAANVLFKPSVLW